LVVSGAIQLIRDSYPSVIRVVIRGDKEDNAVLCTNQQTYELKQGEVSNAMLLIPELNLGQTVQTDGDASVKYREVFYGEYHSKGQ